MAKHVTDFTKPSQQIVIDLINEQNGKNLPYEAFQLGEIVPTPDSKATTLTVSSRRGSGYRGSQTFNYNRIGLAEVPNILTGSTQEADLEKLSDLLTWINATWGINLGPSDVTVNGKNLLVEDDPVVQEYDVEQVFTVQAIPVSYVWMGGLEFTVTKTRSDLNDLITVRELDGLYPPQYWPNEPISASADGTSIRVREDGSYRSFAVPA